MISMSFPHDFFVFLQKYESDMDKCGKHMDGLWIPWFPESGEDYGKDMEETWEAIWNTYLGKHGIQIEKYEIHMEKHGRNMSKHCPGPSNQAPPNVGLGILHV